MMLNLNFNYNLSNLSLIMRLLSISINLSCKDLKSFIFAFSLKFSLILVFNKKSFSLLDFNLQFKFICGHV